jgi:hypothetical protein
MIQQANFCVNFAFLKIKDVNITELNDVKERNTKICKVKYLLISFLANIFKMIFVQKHISIDTAESNYES